MNLREKIIKHNEDYRVGNPSISDEEYDSLLEKFKNESPEEYEEFKNMLLDDVSGNIKLPGISGSLEKFYEKNIDQCLNRIKSDKVIIMPKLDGMSLIVEYTNGKLTKALTRGNGYEGKDKTEFAKMFIPNNLKFNFTVSIRGEVILRNENMKYFATKNPRNTAVGLINSKNPADSLKYLDFIAYEIYDHHSKIEQLMRISELGLNCVDYSIYDKSNLTDLTKILKEIRSNNSKKDITYNIDGIVICSKNYVKEDTLYPTGMIAFKENAQGIETEVKGIRWEVSKQGYLKPIVEIETVEITGTLVSNVTGYNYDYVVNNGLGVGARVKVIKSGEIIPKIVEVTKKSNCEAPCNCPSCNDKLKVINKELVCENSNCLEKNLKKVYSVISKLKIPKVSIATLKKLKINNYEDLVNFVPDMKYKTQAEFYNSLKNKLFNKNEDELFYLFPWDGISDKTLDKIVKSEITEGKTLENYKSQRVEFLKFKNTIEKAKSLIQIEFPLAK